MENISISHFENDAVQDKKLESYDWGKDNFLAGQELTVTVTLREYRELVASKATADQTVQASREKLPRLMQLLGLGDRAPSPSEERYLLGWIDMGFGPEAVALAYDKTVLKCKELKWPYLNKILQNWHQKGLHTLAQVREGDRPASPRQQRQKRPQDDGAPLADMARMERDRRQLNETKEGQ